MLAGRAGVGKDYFGDILIKNHGFVRFAFADALKEEVINLYNLPKEIKKTDKVSETQTYRQLLQEYACTREKDYWAMKVVEQIKNLKKDIVITDFRRPIEYSTFDQHLRGFYLITVKLTNKNNLIIPDNHISEHSLDHFIFDFHLEIFEQPEAKAKNLIKEVDEDLHL
jgi:hypothetical protein